MKFGNSPSEWRHLLPRPGADSHKHIRGRLGVVSGGAFATGAARLSARAGLRVGAGLVKVFCPPDAAPVLAPSLEAVMLASFATPEQLQMLADPMDAVVIGPAAGLIESTALNLAALARTGAALVVDADALTLFRDRPEQLFAWLDRDDVLTPHEGEFERLFPGLLAAEGREGAAQEAARLAGAIVVLKGAAGGRRGGGAGRGWLGGADRGAEGPAAGHCGAGGRLGGHRRGSARAGHGGRRRRMGGHVGRIDRQHMDSFDAARAAVWMHSE